MIEPDPKGHEEPVQYIDPLKWQELVESLDEAAVEVAESFLEDAPTRIAEIWVAANNQDLETVGRLAHSLKSSSAIFGAQQMTRLCLALEMEANQGGEVVIQHLSAVEVVFQKVKKELERSITSYHPID